MTTLYDVLQATKPPVCLLDYLTRRQVKATLAPAALAWVERWQRIYAGQSDSLIDGIIAERTEAPEVRFA